MLFRRIDLLEQHLHGRLEAVILAAGRHFPDRAIGHECYMPAVRAHGRLGKTRFRFDMRGGIGRCRNSEAAGNSGSRETTGYIHETIPKDYQPPEV